jgi:hypothetical protein
MSFIVAKKTPDTPEGWTYFKDYETIDGNKYPMNTIVSRHAHIFDTKEEAAQAYWMISHFFYGYKIYETHEVGLRNASIQKP